MVLPPTLPNPTNNVVDELKKDRGFYVGIPKSDLTNCPIVKTKEGTVTVNYHESPPSPNSENKKYESEKVQMIFIEKGKRVEVTVKFSDGTSKSRQIGNPDVEVTSTYTIEARADQAVVIATVFGDVVERTDIPLEDILFSKGFLAKDALIYAKMLGIEGSFTVG